MKIGFNISVDVTRLDKSRFYKGKKGTYAKLTCFVDTEAVSQYGDHGTITQELSKEDRDNGVKLPILGNAKIFWQDGQSKSTNNQQYSKPEPQSKQSNEYDDGESSDIPF